MVAHSVRRVPAPEASSSQHMSLPFQSYSSSLGASARDIFVSITYVLGAPTVVSFTVLPAVPMFPSTSKGAHSCSCAGSVSACQTISGECRSSLTRMSVHFSPSFRTSAPLAGPGVYCSRLVIFFSLFSFCLGWVDRCDRGGVREHLHARTRNDGRARARHRFPGAVPVSGGRAGAVRPRWLRRNRRRAVRAGAWTRLAAAC